MRSLLIVAMLCCGGELFAQSCPTCPVDSAPKAPAATTQAVTNTSNCGSYREAVRQSNQQMRGNRGIWFPGKWVLKGLKGIRQVQVASVANRADRGRLIPQWRTKKTLARRGR